MPFRQLVLMMLPGMLPLLVYVAAAELWGEMVGLWVGLGLGVAEFFFILVRQRRLDWFVLLDTVLLIGTGAVSLLLDDALFFRFKPVILELLLVILLLASAMGPRNFIMGMVLRGPQGDAMRQALEKNVAAARSMTGTIRVLAAGLGIHALLTLAAALWWSKEVWLFVSGPALYIAMGLWFVVLLARIRIRKARLERQNPQG